MATNNYPTIGSEFLELVESMRKLQKEYFELITADAHAHGDHWRRRALQAAKAAEKKVDAWLATYHAELESYQRAMSEHRTDELPGLYDVAKKE